MVAITSHSTQLCFVVLAITLTRDPVRLPSWCVRALCVCCPEQWVTPRVLVLIPRDPGGADAHVGTSAAGQRQSAVAAVKSTRIPCLASKMLPVVPPFVPG